MKKKYEKRTAALLVAPTMVALAFAVGCASTAPQLAGDASVQRRPNVLLVLADDLGYSDIGVFGGEIPTPNLDRLAGEGRILTNHYANPTCSPTRAALMSGTDSHLAGLGNMAEVVKFTPRQRGKPGYEGYLNERVNWLPQLLRDGGYHTYMAGKWHLGESANAWPVARGFDESFVLLQGGGSHFAPQPGKLVGADEVTYVENDKVVAPPQNFYSSQTYADKLIGNIRQHHGDGKPFFAYAAFTAPHWPLQAPDEDIALFKDRYAAGYEVIREQRIARQKALGLLAPDFKANAGLAPSADYPNWAMLSEAERKLEARKMAVYAAMVHNLDRNIGRLVQTLKDLGEYDNTLIIFMSDNGPEPTDSYFRNNANTDNRLENIGRPLSNVGYGARWAGVSATPFRLFKGWTSEGGIASPAIVRLPGQMSGQPALAQPSHVNDIAPTILSLVGIRAPVGAYQGRTVMPMTGTSLAQAWRERAAVAGADQRVVAGELFGGRYVRQGRWKLVSVMNPFADNSWELYDLGIDRGETDNVGARYPDVVAHMQGLWDAYVARVGLVYAPNEHMADTRRGHTPIGGENVHH
jgi:arylsulfatase A-like enzyme